MKIKINKSVFIWKLQHWGVTVGSLLCVGGLFMSVPVNVQDWREMTRVNHILRLSYTNTIYLRRNEEIPETEAKTGINNDGYQMKSVVWGNPQFGFLGAGMMILGSLSVMVSARALSEKYEGIETKQWETHKSAELLDKTEVRTDLEVDRIGIETTGAAKILHMTAPSTDYFDKVERPEPPKEDLEENVTGFFEWILEQRGDTDQVTFTIRALSQRNFNKKKLPVAKLRELTEELVSNGFARWDDEKTKASFTLLDEEEDSEVPDF